MEADELNLNTNTGKLILCIPYHYDDPISKECKKEIEYFTKNKLWIDVSIYFMNKIYKSLINGLNK